jgi:hypothetical protein
MQSFVLYKNPVRTSQETHYVSATNPNQLMLFRETVAVYCENHTEHTNTLRNMLSFLPYFLFILSLPLPLLFFQGYSSPPVSCFKETRPSI